MKTSFTKKQLSLAVACALGLSFAAGAARAQSLLPNNERELWMEQPANMVYKNAYGECWHSTYGPPPGANECNPAPVAQYVAPPPAPAAAVAPPPPAQAQYVAPPAAKPAPVVVPAPLPVKKDRN